MRLASSPEDWWLLVERCRRVAELTVGDRVACDEAWYQAGRAVECALKARILKREALAEWPDRSERPDLHTHDLRRLLAIAGIETRELPRQLRGRLRTLLDWRNEDRYAAGRAGRAAARTMMRAAFDDGDGVIRWLKTT